MGGSGLIGPAAGRIIEQSLIARHPQQPNADAIVAGHALIGVVDGSTTKPWESTTVTGVHVATQVAAVLSGIVDADLDQVTDLLRATVDDLVGMADLPTDERPCATFAVVNLARREVWRIGDQTVRIDATTIEPSATTESDAAKRRAEVIRRRLRAGDDITTLQAADAGRAAIIDDLRRLNASRNAPDGPGFGAVDGTQVPHRYREVIRLPAGAREVVLATDGYPTVLADLSSTEAALRHRLDVDPLLIDDPPATKGVMDGADSFDDRAYVRVRLADG